MIYLLIWALTIIVSVTLVIIVIKLDIDIIWEIEEIVLALAISFLPFLNLLIIINGARDLTNYLKHKKELKKEIDVRNQNEAFEILDKVKLKYIELYLRKKKLKKLN